MGSAEMVFLLTLPLPEYLYRFVITVVVVAVVYSTVLYGIIILSGPKMYL